ncbi:MAG TPA: TnpV protein [Candidatus Gemmiger excrementigallinarum]|uniref:TnpV protein n=1 Tax=Candidatus Gemmiger excrementigallinarum TaxID=2838609 RepID=A0A9D2EP90_9FIRM|nr:TnpV protein [Candidatus Gemmiger excrementigallinarum]
MEELRQTIQEQGIRYQLKGDYYLPVLELPEESRPIGRWGRLHKAYLKNQRPILYQSLLLSGKLYTVLADLNEQAAERCSLIIRQMAEAEGITEELKANDPMRWVQAMNSIRSRAEEIIQAEMIYC